MQPESMVTTWDTGVDLLLLQHIGLKSVSYPESFVSLFVLLHLLITAVYQTIE